jgi:uncharacterized protein (DUF433 family)
MYLQGMHFERVTFHPARMGGKACIRDLRITVGSIVGLLASGHDEASILKMYPVLQPEDLKEALAFAAWRVEETEFQLV